MSSTRNSRRSNVPLRSCPAGALCARCLAAVVLDMLRVRSKEIPLPPPDGRSAELGRHTRRNPQLTAITQLTALCRTDISLSLQPPHGPARWAGWWWCGWRSKSVRETFAGASHTYTIEGRMGDGKALQVTATLCCKIKQNVSILVLTCELGAILSTQAAQHPFVMVCTLR